MQAASGPVTMVVVAFVIEESTTPGSSPCECGVWSSGSGGVASLGDGVGEGDNDSGGVEPAECYADARTTKKKKTRVSYSDNDNESGAPASLRWHGCERTVKLRREGPYACGCVWY